MVYYNGKPCVGEKTGYLERILQLHCPWALNDRQSQLRKGRGLGGGVGEGGRPIGSDTAQGLDLAVPRGLSIMVHSPLPSAALFGFCHGCQTLTSR